MTLTQLESLRHPTGGLASPDEFVSLAAGALNAVLTVTDGDLDVATSSVDLGNVVRFEDDAPTATLALQGGATVVVDESLGQNGAPETEGGASGLGRVTVLGTTLFTSTAITGQDNEGATTVFSLSIVGAGATGLFSTDNQAITLFDAGGGLIQGRYGAANTVAFTITINAANGDVTLTQLESLRHPTGGLASPDEFVSLAAGALNAVLTVTDGDLDVATSSVDLGNVVRFEDDAPTATLALQGGVTVVVDESLGQNGAPETEGGASGLGRVTVLGTTLFTSTAITGQDNEGATTVFSLSIVGAGATGLFSTDNQAITLFDAGGGLIQGRYGAANTVAFTITINAANGDVTLTQLESLRHPTGGLASPDEFVSLAAGALNAVLTVTDGDLDVATSSVDLGNVVRFEDDAPTATLALQGGVTVVVDESLGQNGAPETEGGASGLGRVTVLGTTLFTSTAITGQDNEGATTVFSLSIVGAGATGLFSTDNQAITLFDAGGGLIQGRYGAANTVAFTITINAANGDVTLTQLESLRHPTGGLASPDEFVSLAAGALNAVLTVTDGDLDVATSSVDLGNVVRFEDDAPTATLALQGGVTVVVDESLGQNGAPETEGGASGLGRVTVLGTTLFTSTAITGQDNEGATTVFSLSIVGAGATGLFSTDNQAITLFDAGGGLI